MSIEIKNGIITKNGTKIGTANKDLKYGYCPAVLVTVQDKHVWFYFNEPGLLSKIADFARESCH